MADGEKPSAYACPHGLDPRRWCDVELRRPDMWGDLRCQRCGWWGKDVPPDERYRWGGFQITQREGSDG